jgi:hypothetical protein
VPHLIDHAARVNAAAWDRHAHQRLADPTPAAPPNAFRWTQIQRRPARSVAPALAATGGKAHSGMVAAGVVIRSAAVSPDDLCQRART